jgi:hypothetical protein
MWKRRRGGDCALLCSLALCIINALLAVLNWLFLTLFWLRQNSGEWASGEIICKSQLHGGGGMKFLNKLADESTLFVLRCNLRQIV